MITKRTKYIVSAVAAILLIYISMVVSEHYAIEQYLDNRAVWKGVSCAIPNTNLRWSLENLKISDNLYENGLKLSDFEETEKCLLSGKCYSIKDCIENESGELTHGLSLVIVDIKINAEDCENEEFNKSQFSLPVNFLKLGNKNKIESFTDPIVPVLIIDEKYRAHSDYIYVEPGTKQSIKLIYTLDDRISTETGYLFTNAIVTQTVSISIPLKNFV